MIIGENRTDIYDSLVNSLARNLTLDFTAENELRILSWDKDLYQEQSFTLEGKVQKLIGAAYVHLNKSEEPIKLFKAMLNRKTATIELFTTAELRMAYIYKSKGDEHSDFPFMGFMQGAGSELDTILSIVNDAEELDYIEDIRDWLQDIIESDLDSKFEFEPVAIAADVYVRHTDLQKLWRLFCRFQTIDVAVHPGFVTFVTDTSNVKVSMCTVQEIS